MNLDGKVCLIVGASSGIGRAIAFKCAKSGATVIAAARRKHLLDSLVNEIGVNAHGFKIDVTNHLDVTEKIKEILENFGRIDCLIYSAGVMTYSLVKNNFFEDWQKMIATNCEGFVDVVGQVYANMLSRNRGHIVVIGSNAGCSPSPGIAVYAGTKYFVEGFLRSLRMENKSSVRITSIQPGDVATPAQQWSTDTEAAQLYSPLHCSPTECERAWEAMLKPTDVADTVVFALTQPKGVAINEILLEPSTVPN